MQIVVAKLSHSFSDGSCDLPLSRARQLESAGRDYFLACRFLVANTRTVGPLFNMLLPTMHQALELLVKAVALACDSTLNPRSYSHRTARIIKDYSGREPIFASMHSDAETMHLVAELEKAYLGVRYGECVMSYDFETWLAFEVHCDALLRRFEKLAPLGRRT